MVETSMDFTNISPPPGPHVCMAMHDHLDSRWDSRSFYISFKKLLAITWTLVSSISTQLSFSLVNLSLIFWLWYFVVVFKASQKSMGRGNDNLELVYWTKYSQSDFNYFEHCSAWFWFKLWNHLYGVTTFGKCFIG